MSTRPAIHTEPAGSSHVFDSLGPRVAAVVVSPFVNAGSVCHELFDHTSVLQMLAELFTPGRPYSADVEERCRKGVKSISAALGDTPRADVPHVPADLILVESALGGGVRLRPSNGLQASFELAAEQLMASDPIATGRKYPELFQWKAAVDAERRRVGGWESLGGPGAAWGEVPSSSSRSASKSAMQARHPRRHTATDWRGEEARWPATSSPLLSEVRVFGGRR